MKKVVVWNWAYVVFISLFSIFLIYWCQFAYTHGYREQFSFWVFFPIENNQLLAFSFGKLRKKSFDLKQVTISFGNKLVLPGKSINMHPIDIRDNQTGKLIRINCGKKEQRLSNCFGSQLNKKDEK